VAEPQLKEVQWDFGEGTTDAERVSKPLGGGMNTSYFSRFHYALDDPPSSSAGEGPQLPFAMFVGEPS